MLFVFQLELVLHQFRTGAMTQSSIWKSKALKLKIKIENRYMYSAVKTECAGLLLENILPEGVEN